MQVCSPVRPLRVGPLLHVEYHQVLRAHTLSAASFLLLEIPFIEPEAPMFLHVPVASCPILNSPAPPSPPTPLAGSSNRSP